MATRKLLGEILLEHGYVKPEHLEDALLAQATPRENRLIGQILVSRGYAKAMHVQIGLAAQEDMSNETEPTTSTAAPDTSSA